MSACIIVGCDEPTIDTPRHMNPNMDWHCDTLGLGACRVHMLQMVDPLHPEVAP